MSFLKIWLMLTGGIIAAGLMWSFAPILIPVLIIGGVLAPVVLGAVAGARWIAARRRPAGQASDRAGTDMQPGQ